MPFLQVGSFVTEVQSADCHRLARREIGEVVEAFAGNLRSTVEGYKDDWRVTTPPLTEADFLLLQTQIGLGMPTVQGDLIMGTAVCNVRMTDAQYIKDTSVVPADYRIIAALEIRQAG